MRVLVTGGAGFIGSHVVDRLIENGHEPRIFDLQHSPHHPSGDVTTVIGDLLDPRAVAAAMIGCDAVLHLAAMADVDVVARQPADAESVNARGTLNVLEAARDAGVERVVYASTIWVYSGVEAGAVDEDSELALPQHLYTATKLAGEMYCRSYSEMYDLDCTILRFGIPYGPRARPEAVVPIFVDKALAGEPLTLANGGTQSRRFVYVEDLADGVVRALEHGKPNGVFNLVSEEDVTIAEVAETVRDVVGEVELIYGPGRSADFAGAHVSGERAASELGWHASTPFAAGVRRYVDWHRAQAASVPAPAALEPSLPLVPAVRTVAQRALPAVLLGGVGLMLGVFLEAFHRAGADGADLRTMSIFSLLGLTLYLSVIPDPGSGGQPHLTRTAWLAAALFVLLFLLWPQDVFRLLGADVDLMLMTLSGAGFGVVAGVAARRLAGGSLRERPSDWTS